MDDNAQSILQRKPMVAPVVEGLRDTRILEAIYKSAATGQRVNL